MPPRVSIRTGEPGDTIALARIHLDARARAMPWLAVVHTPAETERWMADVVLAAHRVRVATVDGEAVGFAALTDGWLEQLYVRPGHQGQSVGSRLFADACAAAGAGKTFRLWVFQRNAAARRFYERHGCRLVKTTDGRENEEREPDALYEWVAPPMLPADMPAVRT